VLSVASLSYRSQLSLSLSQYSSLLERSWFSCSSRFLCVFFCFFLCFFFCFFFFFFLLLSKEKKWKVRQHPRRRPNARRACTFCRDAHTACDDQRPCSRCVRYGRTLEECQDAPRGGAKKRPARHSDKSSAFGKKMKKEKTRHAPPQPQEMAPPPFPTTTVAGVVPTIALPSYGRLVSWLLVALCLSSCVCVCVCV
jgi:Fungal Zn(2)-Cys(6) binuclear cluster domain